jgi:Protein of unknown function (DUF3301)
LIQLLFIFLFALLAWFWYDSMQAREQAISLGKRQCLSDGLQLLDETVSLSSLRLRRTSDGQVAFRRVYEFEFSDNGDNRRMGSVTMLGRHAESIHLEPYLMQ